MSLRSLGYVATSLGKCAEKEQVGWMSLQCELVIEIMQLPHTSAAPGVEITGPITS